MEWWLVLLIVTGLLMVLFLIGVPIAFAFLATTIAGLFWLVGGEKALSLLATNAHLSIGTFTLVALPLFILMGEVLSRGGVVAMLTEVVDVWIGQIPARLCFVSLVAGGILAAMTGTAIGGAVMLATTLFPAMHQKGYDLKLSIGTTMASGVMAAIIPPSVLAVVLGGLAKISIAGLFIGSIIPGLLMLFLFFVFISLLTYFRPGLAPPHANLKLNLVDRLKASRRIFPFVLIIFSVMGVILLGIATPSEAAGTGAMACFLTVAIFGRLTWSVVRDSLLSTMSATGMIFMILVGSITFSQVLAITGATAGLTQYVAGLGLSPIFMFIVMQGLVFLLGMFMESISIMMITVPIFMPVVSVLGIDPLLFGVVYLVIVVVGTMTPPFGMVLFATKGVIPQATIEDVIKASFPFISLSVLALVLMVAFPGIVLWLPNLIQR